MSYTAQKNGNFPSGISLVNVTKSAGNLFNFYGVKPTKLSCFSLIKELKAIGKKFPPDKFPTVFDTKYGLR